MSAHRSLPGEGLFSPVCTDELDSACGFPWHCAPHIRSLTGATTLLVWQMLAGGLQSWSGCKGCPTVCTCKEWGGDGAELVPPVPSAH